MIKSILNVYIPQMSSVTPVNLIWWHFTHRKKNWIQTAVYNTCAIMMGNNVLTQEYDPIKEFVNLVSN